MKNFTQTILRDVYDGSPLELRDGVLHNSLSGRKYEFSRGIAEMLNVNFLTGENEKYKNMYNWMWRGYDFSEKYVGRILYGRQIINMRREIMSRLEIKNGDKVLYVSIGTGTDLDYFPKEVDLKTLSIVGIDISIGMLKKCQKKLKKLKIEADLINACAEALPFAADSFDVVFHVGGINFFSDKRRAINEMVRVAKPGTKILIADETGKLIEELYKKNPMTKKYFDEEKVWNESPVTLLPAGVKDIKHEILMNNRFYSITFRK